MGYSHPPTKPRRTNRQYKPLREAKENKRLRRGHAQPVEEERKIPSEQEIAQDTLKRLHILGNQKFGVFPYSEHFDRWIKSVEAVLSEFAANPNIGIDEEFTQETTLTLNSIKITLDLIQRRETTVNQEVHSLSESKAKLQKINNQYATQASTVRGQKNNEIRRLNREIVLIKQQLDGVIRQKTGFLHFRSKKKREQEEIGIVEDLTNKQNALELAIMDLTQSQKALHEEFDRKREPVAEEIKKYQKRIEDLEVDGSLEERWFACEALADAVNMFLQRKAAKPS
jgi:superfamily II DNA helicase RecQ